MYSFSLWKNTVLILSLKSFPSELLLKYLLTKLVFLSIEQSPLSVASHILPEESDANLTPIRDLNSDVDMENGFSGSNL